MHYLEPLSTVARFQAGMSRNERLTEADMLIARQHAIGQVLRGELDADTLLDVVEDQGIDPAAYAEQAIENIGWAIMSGAQLTDTEDLKHLIL